MDPPFAQPPLSNAAIRSRVTVVCTECKRLKLKCDRKAPCSSCIKRNASAQCQYATNTPNPPDVQTLHQRVSKLEVTMRTHNRNTRDALETRRIPRTIHVAAYSSNVSATPRAGSVLTTPLTGLGRTVTCHVHLDDATQLWADHLLPTPLHETTLVPVTYFAHEPELILPDSTLFAPLNVDALLGRLPPLHLRAALLDSFAQVLHIHTGLEVHRICTGVLSVFHGSAGLAVEPPSCDLPAGFTLPGFALAAASFALGARLYLSSRGHESAEEANGLDPTALMVLSFDTLFLHERKTHTPDCNIEHVLALIVQIHFRLLEGDHNPSPQDMPYCGESLHRTVYPTLLRAISLARTMGLHLQVSNSSTHQAHLYNAPTAANASWLHPDDIEMRRRVWWELMWLDVLISCCLGHPPSIGQGTFDVTLPGSTTTTPFEYAGTDARNGHAVFVHWRSRLILLIKRLQGCAVNEALSIAASSPAADTERPPDALGPQPPGEARGRESTRMAYQYRSASAMDISLERPLPAHLQAPTPPSGTPQPISCTTLAQLKLGESIPGVLPGTSSPFLELRAADAAADNIRGLLEELPASLAFQAGPFDAREESDDHAIPTLRLNRDAGGPFLHMVAQHAVLCQYYPFARKSPQHVPQAALLQIVTAGTEIVRAVSALISSQRTDVPLGYVLARIIFQAAVAAAHVVLRDPVGLLAGPARAVLERVTSILAARAGSQGSAPQLPVWNHRSFAVRVLRLLVPHPYTAPPPPGISRKRKRGQSDAVNMLHSPTDATFTFASAAGSPQAEDEDLELEGFEIPFIGPRISIQRQEESVDDTLKALQLQHTGATVPCIAAARPLEAQHTGASRNSQSEGQGRKHREREKETKGKEGGKKRPQIGIRDRTRPVTIAPAVAPAAAAAVPSPTPTPTPAEAGATHSISSTPSTMSNGSGFGAGHRIIKTEHEGDIVLGSRQAQRRRHDSNHSTTSTHPQEHHVHKFTVPMPPMMMDGIVSAHSYSNGHHSHHYQQIPTPISQPPAPLQPPASLQTEIPPLAPLAPESYSLSESEHHGRPPYDQRRRSSLPTLEPVQTTYHAQQFGMATYGSAMYSGYPQSFEDPMFMYSAGAHEIQPAQPFAHQPSDSAQQVQIPMTYTPPIQYHPGTSEQTQPIASPTQYHPHQREDGRDRDTRMHGAHGQSPQRPPTAVRISSSPGTMSPSEAQQLQHYSRRPSLQHGGSTFLAHAAGQPTVYGDITGPGHSQEVMSTHPFPVTINTAQLHGLEALSDTLSVEFTSHGTFRKRSDTFERERSASSSEGLALEPPAAWPTPADDSHTRWVTDPH